jgi:hypothetical protein
VRATSTRALPVAVMSGGNRQTHPRRSAPREQHTVVVKQGQSRLQAGLIAAANERCQKQRGMPTISAKTLDDRRGSHIKEDLRADMGRGGCQQARCDIAGGYCAVVLRYSPWGCSSWLLVELGCEAVDDGGSRRAISRLPGGFLLHGLSHPLGLLPVRLGANDLNPSRIPASVAVFCLGQCHPRPHKLLCSPSAAPRSHLRPLGVWKGLH